MAIGVPQKQTAVRIHTIGDASVLKLEDVAIPELQPDQVLVRNHYAGVNYLDIYHRTGVRPVKFPATLGIDGGGEVVAIGSAVPAELGLKQGDLVVYVSSASYAEYTAVPANMLVKLPEGVTMKSGVAAMTQGMTAVELATSAYPVSAGEWVLVFAAAGGTGSLITQVAAAAGAHVIGVTSTEEKAKLVKAHGAAHTVLSDDLELVKKVLELTGGKGVRAVFDSIGAATWETSKAVLGYGGTVVAYGFISGAVPPIELHFKDLPKNMKAVAFTLFEALKAKGMAPIAKQTLALMQSGKLKASIHEVYPLVEASKAHLSIEGRKSTGKILLAIQPDIE